MGTSNAWGCGALALGLGWVAGACGSAPPKAEVSSPFTSEHAEIFENGIDFIDDPTALEGAWRDDWSRGVDRRVSHSDVIALVKVRYLRTDTDPERNQTLRLVCDVHKSLWGKVPDDELTVVVRQGEAGYGTIKGHENRLLKHSFVAFIKWVRPEETPAVVPRWHLAPATDGVVERVQYLIEHRRQGQSHRAERVFVHDSE